MVCSFLGGQFQQRPICLHPPGPWTPKWSGLHVTNLGQRSGRWDVHDWITYLWNVDWIHFAVTCRWKLLSCKWRYTPKKKLSSGRWTWEMLWMCSGGGIRPQPDRWQACERPRPDSKGFLLQNISKPQNHTHRSKPQNHTHRDHAMFHKPSGRHLIFSPPRTRISPSSIRLKACVRCHMCKQMVNLFPVWLTSVSQPKEPLQFWKNPHKHQTFPLSLCYLRPSGKFLSTSAGRYLIGRELLALMGVPIHQLNLGCCRESVSWLKVEGFFLYLQTWFGMCMCVYVHWCMYVHACVSGVTFDGRECHAHAFSPTTTVRGIGRNCPWTFGHVRMVGHVDWLLIACGHGQKKNSMHFLNCMPSLYSIATMPLPSSTCFMKVSIGSDFSSTFTKHFDIQNKEVTCVSSMSPQKTAILTWCHTLTQLTLTSKMFTLSLVCMFNSQFPIETL